MSQNNDNLRNKLKSAQKWMKKSVLNAQKEIHNEQILLNSLKRKSTLIEESMFGLIADKIMTYFDHKTISEIHEYELELLIKSEIAYYLLISEFPIEPLSIAITYNKIIDHYLETTITNIFQKKQKSIKRIKPQNIFREKRLYSVLYYNYSISMGVIASLIAYKDNEDKLYYENIFWKTINENNSLKTLFSNTTFTSLWQKINNSEIFSEKRHLGEISIDEIKNIRTLITGNFENKDSLIYFIL